jgi:hypothetical protein
MPGITASTTSPVGNVDGAQLHFAVSTGTKAATGGADTARLVANGGYYRPGDAVTVVCTDGLLSGKVGADGAIAA